MVMHEERRYPMPMPFGWFQVAWPDEIDVGAAIPLYYFGRHLVAWRDAGGSAHLMDAFCPHLGTHLGHGGMVEDDCIVCPLHNWAFDADGNNVDIPYSERINQRARIRTYPVVERNGLVLAWYHPTDAPPSFDPPEIPEFSGHDGWSDVYRRHYQVNCHWQEVAETTADAAHVQAHLVRYEKQLNGGQPVPVRKPGVESYETDGPVARMRFAQSFPTPAGLVEGRIDTDAHGPGIALTWFTGLIDTGLLGCAVPVDEERCELRFNFVVRQQGDAAATSSLADAFVEEIHSQTVEDVPVWENKAYVPRPALADNDGPIMKFRRWAGQFYAEGVLDGDELWEPAPPAERQLA
jgi:phenylpropionate dioxygenase-like ring-hydroxylating dioxygenase large terminal subunit